VRRDAESWTISGQVSHVPLADVASYLLVDAVDDAGDAAVFLVRLDADGVSMEAQSSIDRQPRHRLTLTDAPVPAGDVVVAPGAEALTAIRWLEAHGLAARCIDQLGHASAALEMAARHVSTRHQFGRPVGTFQAVAHRVADAYIDVQGLRLTAWRAAWLLSQEYGSAESAESLSIAAWWAASAPTRVVEAAMHVHGGLSVDLDYPLHRHYLACKNADLLLGGVPRRSKDLARAMRQLSPVGGK
jgi:alkylation response protein AidB-like acyl-CoA dehydrogenase